MVEHKLESFEEHRTITHYYYGGEIEVLHRDQKNIHSRAKKAKLQYRLWASPGGKLLPANPGGSAMTILSLSLTGDGVPKGLAKFSREVGIDEWTARLEGARRFTKTFRNAVVEAAQEVLADTLLGFPKSRGK